VVGTEAQSFVPLAQGLAQHGHLRLSRGRFGRRGARARPFRRPSCQGGLPVIEREEGGNACHSSVRRPQGYIPY
jgi:hypothetical protein